MVSNQLVIVTVLKQVKEETRCALLYVFMHLLLRINVLRIKSCILLVGTQPLGRTGVLLGF